MAERLGRALQKLLHQFESGQDLKLCIYIYIKLHNKKKLVVIDRDGTLIIDKHYLSDPNNIELIPGTITSLKRLYDNGILIALHTNQSGIERQYFNLDDVNIINQKMIDLIGLGNNIFCDICISPNIKYSNNNYRKPSPKFAKELMKKYSLNSKSIAYIGDSIKDKMCAEKVNCDFFWMAYQNKEDLDCKPYMNINTIVDELLK